MTLQEETLRKGKSVHPTLQITELHCRFQHLFLRIKMLSSVILETVKFWGKGGGKKKAENRKKKERKKKLGLIWFTFGFIFIATNVSVQQLQVPERAGAVHSGEHRSFRSDTNNSN